MENHAPAEQGSKVRAKVRALAINGASESEEVMDYIIPGLALLAGFHAYTYARWLKQKGNRIGSFGVMVLTAAAVAVPMYRLFSAP